MCYNKIRGEGIRASAENRFNTLNVPAGFKAKRDELLDFYCGCEYTIGSGKFLCLFARPDAGLIRQVCDYFKISPPSVFQSPEITTTVLKGKQAHYLFALNNGLMPQAVSVKIDKRILKHTAKVKRLLNTGNRVYLDKKNSRLTFDLDEKDAAVFELCS